MRRMNICEEKNSGIDKVIHAVEMFLLPARIPVRDTVGRSSPSMAFGNPNA